MLRHFLHMILLYLLRWELHGEASWVWTRLLVDGHLFDWLRLDHHHLHHHLLQIFLQLLFRFIVKASDDHLKYERCIWKRF